MMVIEVGCWVKIGDEADEVVGTESEPMMVGEGLMLVSEVRKFGFGGEARPARPEIGGKLDTI